MSEKTDDVKNIVAMSEDKSILKSKQIHDGSFSDELAFAVCVNGESIEKYKKIAEKQFGKDTYTNMVLFIQTLQQQISRRQFTNTSLLSLKHLGKNAGMSEDAIDMIIDHFNNKVEEELRILEENEYWNNCPKNNRNSLLGYLRKYPQGRYVKEAHSQIRIIEKEEIVKREDMDSWKKVNQNDKHQLKEYLIKYPTGKYVDRARLKIAELERIEKEAIEESRFFNQCHTQRDYMNYLSKYPNGAYYAKAKTIIEESERKEAEKTRRATEENRAYNLCKDKKDYQNYLRDYPNGKYIYEAKTKIQELEFKDYLRQEETKSWNQCNHNDKQSLKDYLKKYPNGTYAIQAKSHIAEIERIESDAIEESRMYNQCRSRVDYMDYLRKYPNGYYKRKAMYEIDILDKASKKEKDSYIKEQETYEQCKTIDDYLHYISLYPEGKYVLRARNKIEHLEKIKIIKSNNQQKQKEKKQDEGAKEKRTRFKKKWMLVPLYFTVASLFLGIFDKHPATIGSAIALYGQISQYRADEKKPKAMMCFYIGAIIMIIAGFIVGIQWEMGLFILILAAITSYIYRK